MACCTEPGLCEGCLALLTERSAQGDESTIPLLKAVLIHRDVPEHNRLVAAKSLKQLVAKGCVDAGTAFAAVDPASLDTGSRDILVSALVWAARKGHWLASEALARLVCDDSLELTLRHTALDGLVASSSRNNAASVKELMKLVSHPVAALREKAGKGLVVTARRGNEQALTFLTEAADDETWPGEVRSFAETALRETACRLGNVSSIEKISLRLESDDEDAIATSLESLELAAYEGHTAALDCLSGYLQRTVADKEAAAGKEERVRRVAAALGVGAREGHALAIATLGSLARDLPPTARLAATKGLAGAAAGTEEEGGSERAVELLFGLTHDPDPEVRHVAYDGLAAAAALWANEPSVVVLSNDVVDTSLDISPQTRTCIVNGLLSAFDP